MSSMQKGATDSSGRKPRDGKHDKPVFTNSKKQLSGMMQELDIFDFSVDRVSTARFQAARKKIKDYIGTIFGYNADSLNEHNFP